MSTWLHPPNKTLLSLGRGFGGGPKLTSPNPSRMGFLEFPTGHQHLSHEPLLARTPGFASHSRMEALGGSRPAISWGWRRARHSAKNQANDWWVDISWWIYLTVTTQFDEKGPVGGVVGGNHAYFFLRIKQPFGQLVGWIWSTDVNW